MEYDRFEKINNSISILSLRIDKLRRNFIDIDSHKSIQDKKKLLIEIEKEISRAN